MIIMTLGDLWKHINVYPERLYFFVNSQNIEGWIYNQNEMKEFLDKYKNFELNDFAVELYSCEGFELSVELEDEIKKEEQ